MQTASGDNLYCTEQDVADRLSSAAVDLHTDDSATGTETQLMTDVREEASADIELRLGSMYEPSALATSRWVRFCCRAFACYLLCIRRGNPPPASITADYEKYSEQLTLISDGTIRIPGLARAPGGPAVSNQSYDLRKYPGLQIERPRSGPLAGSPVRKFDQNADVINNRFG